MSILAKAPDDVSCDECESLSVSAKTVCESCKRDYTRAIMAYAEAGDMESLEIEIYWLVKQCVSLRWHLDIAEGALVLNHSDYTPLYNDDEWASQVLRDYAARVEADERRKSKSQRDPKEAVLSIVGDLEAEFPDGVPMDEIIDIAEQQGFGPEKIRAEVEAVHSDGQLCTPRVGKYLVTGDGQ